MRNRHAYDVSGTYLHNKNEQRDRRELEHYVFDNRPLRKPPSLFGYAYDMVQERTLFSEQCRAGVITSGTGVRRRAKVL